MRRPYYCWRRKCSTPLPNFSCPLKTLYHNENIHNFKYIVVLHPQRITGEPVFITRKWGNSYDILESERQWIITKNVNRGEERPHLSECTQWSGRKKTGEAINGSLSKLLSRGLPICSTKTAETRFEEKLLYNRTQLKDLIVHVEALEEQSRMLAEATESLRVTKRGSCFLTWMFHVQSDLKSYQFKNRNIVRALQLYWC